VTIILIYLALGLTIATVAAAVETYRDGPGEVGATSVATWVLLWPPVLAILAAATVRKYRRRA
jgi:hypothetical protein